MHKQIKNEHWNIQVFTHRTFAVFISLLLLSDVGIAGGRYEVKAQQQPQSQEETSAAAERVFKGLPKNKLCHYQ